jgi:hypothetical protein
MVDVLEPDLVAGLQRGQELEPIFGAIDRFFGMRRARPVHPDVVTTSVEERMAAHEKAMAGYFEGEQQRFRSSRRSSCRRSRPVRPAALDISSGCPTGMAVSSGSGCSATCPRTQGSAHDTGGRASSP